jgi:hypothetical protein
LIWINVRIHRRRELVIGGRGSLIAASAAGHHLHNASSFTAKYPDGHGARLRGGYTFRCLAVKEPRRRALLEAYAIGFLCPAHIGLGQLRA